MNLRDWQLRLRALVAPNRVERDLHDELSFHIARETQRLIDEGVDPAEARLKAQARFGSTTVAADECRDERGTAFIDNTIGDILYAFRMFARAPLVGITIVLTVGLGLGLVAVLFTVLNVFVFRVDKVPNVHEMVEVQHLEIGDERPPFLRPQFDAMRRETHVFTDIYAEMAGIDARVDGRMMSIALLSGNAFQVMGVHAALGRTLLPGDDDRTAPQPVVVLSDRGWHKLFAGDPNIIGRRVIVNGGPFEIIGVMPPGFRGLRVSVPDLWGPLSELAEFRPMHRGREDKVGLAIIGRLKPGTRSEAARAELAAWDQRQTPAAAATDRPTVNVELNPHQGTVPQPLEAIAIFSPLFFAFGLILMIGCANVANLLLARAMARQREFGIRLSLGASRRRIIRQLLTESLLLALVAAAAGFAVSRVAIEVLIAAVMNSMPPDIGDVRLAVPEWDWRVVLFLIGGAIVSTGFFGLMPALQATRIEPMRTLRGEVLKDARPRRSRNILIGIQVGASALLLICAAVFLRSAWASAMLDPGMRTSDTMIIEVSNEPKRQVLVQAVTTDPSVRSVAVSWPDMFSPTRAAVAQSGATKLNLSYKFVSFEYFDVLGIPIVAGRSFTDVERSSDLAIAIVNQKTAQALWPGANAVGQTVQVEPDPNSKRGDEPPLLSRTFTVVGVARDVPGFRMGGFDQAGVYVPINATVAKTSLIARVHGDSEQARQRLLDRLTLVDPNMGQVITMKTIARTETYLLQVAFWVTLVLGALALALTVSGLFSVLSYLVEQRTKEIGVRMALGATSQNVTRLVLSQTIRPVGYGLLAGGGLTAGLATVLIATPAAATIAEIIHVADPVAYAVSVILIVGACLVAAVIPARRASRLDPNQTLRQE